MLKPHSQPTDQEDLERNCVAWCKDVDRQEEYSEYRWVRHTALASDNKPLC